MKSLLLADDRHALLAALEPVLKHWGYRVLTATGAARATAFLAASSPVLLLIGSNLLSAPELRLPKPAPPLLALAHPAEPSPADHHDLLLNVPVDIFQLYAFIQSRVEKYPRHDLRLRVRLPGMHHRTGEEFVRAEVLSLSMNGLFSRSPLRLAAGDHVSAVFSLLGHGRELEVSGRVLYAIEPVAANDYRQGFAMNFATLTPEQGHQLRRFLIGRLFQEVAASQTGVDDFSADHLLC